MSTDQETQQALKGFTPVPSHIYLEKQPNLSLFCKPLILPLKSPNLQMLEKMESAANANSIQIPAVVTAKK